MILFTPVPAVATPETALAAIVTAIVTATGPSDASRATAGAGRDVAPLTRRVLRALLDRDRDGLFVFFVGVVLLGAAAATYRSAFLVRVLAQASLAAVPCVAPNAFPEPVLVQGSGADPTGGQDHRAFEA